MVWIDVSVAEGIRRTAGERTRPVLKAANPEEHYRNLLETRRPYYQEVSTFRVRTNSRSPQQVVAEVLHHLENE